MSEAIVPFSLATTPVSQVAAANAVDNKKVGRDPNARGMFAQTPVSTPKFVNFHENRKHEYEDTMARMLLQIPEGTMDSLIDELEDSDTKEIVKILANDGSPSDKGGYGYIDFLLQTATHSFNEKVQISESLSDNYVAFFYGSSPTIFQYSGTLMNTFEDDWNMRMFRIFRDLGRGTQLARRGSLFHLKYDSIIVSGAMLNFNSTLVAGQEMAVNFSFNFLVKKIEIVLGSYVKTPTNLKLMEDIQYLSDTLKITSNPGSPGPFGILTTLSGQSKTIVSSPSSGARPSVSFT